MSLDLGSEAIDVPGVDQERSGRRPSFDQRRTGVTEHMHHEHIFLRLVDRVNGVTGVRSKPAGARQHDLAEPKRGESPSRRILERLRLVVAGSSESLDDPDFLAIGCKGDGDEDATAEEDGL